MKARIIIYIPLCLYQYFSQPIFSINSKSIYIPLCLYQYTISFALAPSDISLSTFHSVYISTQIMFMLLLLLRIYIPLCLYQYKKGGIDYAFCDVSTFHSVYISTHSRCTESVYFVIYIPLCLYQYQFLNLCRHLFDNIYIPLCLYQYITTRTRIMNTVSIYIPLCLYQYVAKNATNVNYRISTFHSVYISTSFLGFCFEAFVDLHSTLFILVRYAE